jgi:class 3 adenylate cyclase/CheY-like chemotaxis protein
VSSTVPTILVVDDVSTNVRVLGAILEPNGYKVVAATSGADALVAIRDIPVDLVLLDINMPGMNGLEVCRRLRAMDPERVLPIVMVTAGAEESTGTAIEAGADDFLVRPFDHSELLARVKSHLRVKQLHDVVEAQAAELAALNDSLQELVQMQLEELLGLRRLRRFLSPQLAEVVLSAGDEALLEPHRQEIGVLFCDLRGFTRFAGEAEPEELLDVLREFHSVLGELVAQHDATVGHFAGDGVMLFFNDPLPCPEPALRAAHLAIELRDAFRPLRAGWLRGGHDLDIGIGISLGFATLGTIGFEGRYDYSALGPVVNQASRLCSAAAPGEILAGPRAFAEIEPYVDAEELGPVDAKGFAQPIATWRVVALREWVSPEPGR